MNSASHPTHFAHTYARANDFASTTTQENP